MKKLLLLIISVALCIGLTACVDEGSPSENSTPQPLSIVDSGYKITKNVDEYFLYCSVKIKNPNKTLAAQTPTFRVTAKSSSGGVVGTEDQTMSVIYPNTTTGYGAMILSAQEKPEKVEIEMLDIEEGNWVETDMLEHSDMQQLTTKSVTYNDKESPDISMAGEVVNPNAFGFDTVAVSVLFKDKEGNLIGGDSTYVDSVKANGKAPFDISLYSDFATKNYEIFVNSWD